MTLEEFNELAKDLQTLSEINPLNWKKILNSETESKGNRFQINSFKRLESEIINFTEVDKDYFRKRWFVLECSRCDDYLFKSNKNVIGNLKPKEQSFDLEFNQNPKLRFVLNDLELPKKYRNKIKEIIQNPTPLIQSFYREQSKSERNNMQNSLFVIHYSQIAPEREMRLRCLWDFKNEVFKKYAEQITTTANFITYKKTIADVIFIIENEDQTISSHFFAVPSSQNSEE